MAKTLAREKVVELLRARLSSLPSYVRAVLLFGSVARDEATERSDVDLLVLHEGLKEGLVRRRRHLYRIVMERIGSVFDSVTLIDMELRMFITPREITPLLLNVYSDAVVIIDRVGYLEDFLRYVRRRIDEVGLKRVRIGRTYGWILPKPIERIEML